MHSCMLYRMMCSIHFVPTTCSTYDVFVAVKKYDRSSRKMPLILLIDVIKTFVMNDEHKKHNKKNSKIITYNLQ